MSKKYDQFGERLKIAMGDDSPYALAKKCNISNSLIRRYVGGDGLPGTEHLVTLSKITGANIEWLATGDGPMHKNDALPAADTGGILATTTPHPFIITDFDGNQTEVTLAPNLVHMPVLSLDAACGRGACGDNAYITSMVSATEDWFRLKVRKDPKDMCLVHALGDSMEPLIEDGDMVFFDKTTKTRPCDGIWVFAYEDRLFLKRLQFLPDGKIKVISSNAAYEPYVINIDESFRLFGRYVAVLGFRT